MFHVRRNGRADHTFPWLGYDVLQLQDRLCVVQMVFRRAMTIVVGLLFSVGDVSLHLGIPLDDVDADWANSLHSI